MSISPFLRAISLVRRALLGITLLQVEWRAELNCSVKSQKRETLLETFARASIVCENFAEIVSMELLKCVSKVCALVYSKFCSRG
jgi:hypothetical protein